MSPSFIVKVSRGKDLVEARREVGLVISGDAITAAPKVPNPEITGTILIAGVDETDLRTITAKKHVQRVLPTDSH